MIEKEHQRGILPRKLSTRLLMVFQALNEWTAVNQIVTHMLKRNLLSRLSSLLQFNDCSHNL
jgi:hypothetical protein